MNKSKAQVFFVSMSPTHDRWRISCNVQPISSAITCDFMLHQFICSSSIPQSWGLGWSWWSQLLPRNGTNHQRRVFGKWVEARADASCGSGHRQTADKRPWSSNPEHYATIGVSQRCTPFHLQKAVASPESRATSQSDELLRLLPLVSPGCLWRVEWTPLRLYYLKSASTEMEWESNEVIVTLWANLLKVEGKGEISFSSESRRWLHSLETTWLHLSNALVNTRVVLIQRSNLCHVDARWFGHSNKWNRPKMIRSKLIQLYAIQIEWYIPDLIRTQIIPDSNYITKTHPYFNPTYKPCTHLCSSWVNVIGKCSYQI